MTKAQEYAFIKLQASSPLPTQALKLVHSLPAWLVFNSGSVPTVAQKAHSIPSMLHILPQGRCADDCQTVTFVTHYLHRKMYCNFRELSFKVMK